MIDIPVVLVLGAGASFPYRFPLGWKLKEDAERQPVANIRRYLDSIYPEAAKQLDEFQYELKRCKCGSIDAFVEGRPEFESVGKAVIAFCLIRHEVESRLLDTERDTDWYAHLIDLMLTDGLKRFRQNKLSIITFNYDRSLRHYFLTVLQARFGIRREESEEALSQVPIIHVHGKLGELTDDDDDKDGRLYEDQLDSHRLKLAMDGIHIAYDRTLATDPEFVRARDKLAGAQNVIFLGFGYLKENVERLRLNENRKDSTLYWGSGYDIRAKEADFINRLFPDNGDVSRIVIDTEAKSVLDYIRNIPHLFTKLE